ncbi:asparagine synthase (glutamine-hydrolyzing) [Maribacter polysiphoniae]|uniref:asparagine synthase (glutamine-hydrolyzing) n=1 Tax=Maribacter polysiphoniae TaxID=429344 RepID=A0A316E1F4_9FLAO|nr:asparagine synthase (glutamine-hydrolyzing) [Maribacter polysiphoniae]MBD1260917.1 asparagine synthase (glutamine-hydrolyzing) [Maribacter polysiphoniae]PWK23945.1 asparagine synthase (glutamine-hydrolysing) [Maribacter polysiphoniae]
MCGIAGFHHYKDANEDNVNILKKMLTRIKYRGPDESGIYLSKEIALGSVRLSIIDISTGSMPLTNEDSSLWIVFNGEIFNYIELRQELLKRGHTFKTQSDTEVIVHLYQEFGSAFLNKLNGQFAIAIWDKNKKELFLARDRVGIRPLFHTTIDNTFIFASEIKSLLEYPKVEATISPKALSEYFTFWTSLSPNTAFENIYELPPGTYMIVNSKGKTTAKYWELPTCKPQDYKFTNLQEASNEFNDLFSDAIKLRLRADVQVAAYLSGGIDSSVTTSFIKNASPDKLRTFSIGFTEKDYDESSYQDIAAKYFDTAHSSISCSPEDIANNFSDIVWHTEAPILRTAPAPMGMLAKSVRDQNIKVVITGEGADELLGGYNIFKETKIRHFWSKDPQSRFRPLLLKKLYPYLPQMKNANSNMLKMFFGYKLNKTCSPIYSHLLRWNNTGRINNYLSKEYKERIIGYNPVNELEKKLADKLDGYDYLTKAQWIEITLFMSGYLLSSQGDRMGMSHSVEGRYPFLDHRVIEFCMKLHPDLKLKILNEKYLLKKIMKDRLPDVILNRSKQAYRAPIKSSFISEELPQYLQNMLSDEKIEEAGIFNKQYVNLLLSKMKIQKLVSEIDNMALTGILSSQILYDKFTKRSFPPLSDQDLIILDKTIIDK